MSSVKQRVSKLTQPSSWVLEPEAATFAPNNKWSNKDMDVVPPHLRTWSSWDFVAYWLSDAANVATWNMASSMLAIGLSWRQVLPAIAVGHFIIAIVITLNGTIGAQLHVPFPVVNRSSFGFYFAYFSIISRAILAMFWFGIQTTTGGECVYQMLKAIWPSIQHLPNHLPENASITTSAMMCYFLYWIIQLPLLLVPVHKIRWLFNIKSIIVPACWLSMFIWALAKTGGASGTSIYSQPATIHGSKAVWAWFGAVNSALGNFATLGVNIPDFTRFARSPRAQYAQMLVIPVAFTFFAFIGLTVTSSGYEIYGKGYLWDPLTLIDQWDNRAAAFFASFCFALATVATNIGANSISCANDLTALAPRYINIRRGQVICALIGGWVLCPWEILASAIGFLTFMGGYTIVLGPISAIMIVDYYLVHKKKIDTPSLYRPKGRYRYTGGVNMRALAAIIVAVPPNLPGLINAINPKIDVGGGIYPYNIAYLLGFTLAGTVYYTLSIVFPPTETLLDAPITGEDEVERKIPSEHDEEGSIDEKKGPNAREAVVEVL
ncbi:hypothetical protein FRC04_011632 [Tulasnella sp. 424]|nr:hypothetical protein FRC04_011632 [Tulasnella sp. 424]KAG8971450.1 hypothetical protein FRC05_011023 [Tulasnella sp. 425]